MLKPLTVWIITNCGKLLKRWKYQTILSVLKNLYVGQEATVRTLYVTTDWFSIEKGVQQGCLLSPCLFKLYWLEEAQVGIKTAGRNINNSDIRMIPL